MTSVTLIWSFLTGILFFRYVKFYNSTWRFIVYLVFSLVSFCTLNVLQILIYYSFYDLKFWIPFFDFTKNLPLNIRIYENTLLNFLTFDYILYRLCFELCRCLFYFLYMFTTIIIKDNKTPIDFTKSKKTQNN